MRVSALEGVKMEDKTKTDRLEDLKVNLQDAEQELEDLENGNKEDEYDEWLDDIHEPYKIGVCEFYASKVLSELDPIAYNCGYGDYVESERESYQQTIDDIKEEIEDLKVEK